LLILHRLALPTSRHDTIIAPDANHASFLPIWEIG
jgi:hypothetical protein